MNYKTILLLIIVSTDKQFTIIIAVFDKKIRIDIHLMLIEKFNTYILDTILTVTLSVFANQLKYDAPLSIPQ